MISTRNLSQLPDIDGLRRLLQSMAMLDAILSPNWQYRYYSFNSSWSAGELMGSMRNGHGDDIFALFNTSGCFIKGFAHEALMTPYRCDPTQLWPGLIEAVPPEFANCLTQPAFDMQGTTFCVWRRYQDGSWQRGAIDFPPGDDPDGSATLLSPLDGKPETYCEWARWYFDKPFLDVNMVRHIYDHRPLTNELVANLTQDITLEDEENPHLEVSDFEDDIKEIGYPHSAS